MLRTRFCRGKVESIEGRIKRKTLVVLIFFRVPFGPTDSSSSGSSVSLTEKREKERK